MDSQRDNITQKEFWAEFIKVQVDKFALIGLFWFLYHVHADERLLYAVLSLIGASLGYGRRFKF